MALSAANGGNSGSVDVSCCEEDMKAAGPCPQYSSQHAEDTLEEEDRALLRQTKAAIRHGESLVVMYGPGEHSIIIPDGCLLSESKVTLFRVYDVAEYFLTSERACDFGEGPAVDGKGAAEELKKVLDDNDEAEKEEEAVDEEWDGEADPVRSLLIVPIYAGEGGHEEKTEDSVADTRGEALEDGPASVCDKAAVDQREKPMKEMEECMKLI